MSEIQDLKNHITAFSSKINHIVDMVRNSFTVNDKISELMALMHQIGLTNQQKNQDIFDCLLPDLIKRLGVLENLEPEPKKELSAGDYVEFFVGKRKRRKVHMVIKEDGVTFYTENKSLFAEL